MNFAMEKREKEDKADVVNPIALEFDDVAGSDFAITSASKTVAHPRVPVDRKLQETQNVGWATNGWFSPDARTLATASKANQLVVHDLQSGSATVAVDHPCSIMTTAVSPLGDLCCIGDDSGALVVFQLDLATFPLKQLWECKNGHKHTGEVVSALFSSDGRFLYACRGNGVRVHDAIAGGDPKRTLQIGRAASLGNVLKTESLSLSGDLLAVRWSERESPDGHDIQRSFITIWRVSKGFEEISEAFECRQSDWSLQNCALRPGGKQLALVPPHADENCGDIELRALPGAAELQLEPIVLGSTICHFVRCLQYSPDGGLLAVAHANEEFEIFDTHTLAPVRRLVKSLSDGAACLFSPAGDVLACAGTNCGYWTLFDVKTPVRAARAWLSRHRKKTLLGYSPVHNTPVLL